MKIEFDFSELIEFAENLTNEQNLETTLMTATQNIARVLHDELLKRTPVDTGNLRKMWSAGENLLFTVDKVQGGYEVTLVNKATNKQSVADSQIRDSGNGFMYGVAVNDGHKQVGGGWVQGKFFVEASINGLADSARLESIVYKELQKWWKGV